MESPLLMLVHVLRAFQASKRVESCVTVEETIYSELLFNEDSKSRRIGTQVISERLKDIEIDCLKGKTGGNFSIAL